MRRFACSTAALLGLVFLPFIADAQNRINIHSTANAGPGGTAQVTTYASGNNSYIRGSASNQGYYRSDLYMTGNFARGHGYEVNATAEGNAPSGGYASGNIEVNFSSPGNPVGSTNNYASNNGQSTTTLYARDDRPVPPPPEPRRPSHNHNVNVNFTTNYLVVPVYPVYVYPVYPVYRIR